MAEVMQAEQKCGCAIRAEYGSILEDSKDVLTFKGITYCPLHAAASALLEALELLLGCADWESEDIATINVTQFKASMDQATTALAAARGQEVHNG